MAAGLIIAESDGNTPRSAPTAAPPPIPPSKAEDKMQKYCVLFAPELYDINPDDPDAITAKALELATNDTFDYKCLCYPVLDASCFDDDINDEAPVDPQNNDDLYDLFD